jgi:leader peptidase (prepilin peptidase)/N-methyltransferase
MDPQSLAGTPDLTALHVFLSVCALVMGLVWGSFFNVCVFRIPAKKSIVQPPSHCGTCGTPLKPWQNVPVFAWLFLGGRCGHCGQTYGMRYPLVEFLTGILFLLVYLQTGPSPLLLVYAVFTGLLVIGVFTDIDHFILPDRITLGGAAAVVAMSPFFGRDSIAARDLSFLVDQAAFWFAAPEGFSVTVLPPWAHGLLGSVSGALAGYGFLWGIAVLGQILFRKEAMGGGDVKLFALIGACLGVVNAVMILFAAAMLGLVLGMYALIAHRLFGRDETDEISISAWDREPEGEPVVVRIDRRTARRLREFPFGPHIAIAALLTLLFQADVREVLHGRVDAISPSAALMPTREPYPGIIVPAIRLIPEERP